MHPHIFQPLGPGSRSVFDDGGVASSASPAISEQSPIVRREEVEDHGDDESDASVFKRPLSLVEVCPFVTVHWGKSNRHKHVLHSILTLYSPSYC